MVKLLTTTVLFPLPVTFLPQLQAATSRLPRELVISGSDYTHDYSFFIS